MHFKNESPHMRPSPLDALQNALPLLERKSVTEDNEGKVSPPDEILRLD